ncbi:polysaccharide deacetylase family protein [Roseobacter weihaiensis]|uniref:polysaccharide deacetylase family protein n=1 Tax=Roseobacter weihaiensis TaxID=2763262 RepID=UPI001D09FED5|nr:polysaccharide deacetylase family protein [Roseobacter sp. H9]
MTTDPHASDGRDWVGYGRSGFDPNWPGGAFVAVQFVLNYEEGGERNVLDGDDSSEARLSELVGAEPRPGRRNRSMETLFEYGSRAGFWRLWRLFCDARIPVVFGVSEAPRRNPEAVQAMQEAGWEVACHGMRWLRNDGVPEETERADIRAAIKLHEDLIGKRPLGWYTGAQSERTMDLVMEAGGFRYLSDGYADDLPYWINGPGGRQLVIPYAFDTNDILYEEGRSGAPKMMSVGLHCRITGRPGRAVGLRAFLDHLASRDRVWIARRIDIADHWHKHHVD